MGTASGLDSHTLNYKVDEVHCKEWKTLLSPGTVHSFIQSPFQLGEDLYVQYDLEPSAKTQQKTMKGSFSGVHSSSTPVSGQHGHSTETTGGKWHGIWWEGVMMPPEMELRLFGDKWHFRGHTNCMKILVLPISGGGGDHHSWKVQQRRDSECKNVL